MSLWDELIPKLTKISTDFSKNLQYELDLGLAALDEFEKEALGGRLRVLELLSIREDQEDPKTTPIAAEQTKKPAACPPEGQAPSSPSSDRAHTTAKVEQGGRKGSGSETAPGNKKRSKEEMGGNNTPEQDKRHKRTASVKAQGIISKQVNVNLTAKMRRPMEEEAAGRELPAGESDKENCANNVVPLVRVKQEKVSLPPAEPAPAAEPCDTPAAPAATAAPTPAVKLEADEKTMPPPPAPKSRRGRDKKKADAEREQETEKDKDNTESSGRERERRSTRSRKQPDVAAAAAAAPPAERRTRASSRATSQAAGEEAMPPPPPPEPRPKRTRARKQQQLEAASDSEAEKSSEPAAVDADAKPRPKRTRRGRKASTKEEEQAAAPAPAPSPAAPAAVAAPAAAAPSTPPSPGAPAKRLKQSRSLEAASERDAAAAAAAATAPAAPAAVTAADAAVERGSSVLEVQEKEQRPIDLEETQIVWGAAPASPATPATPAAHGEPTDTAADMNVTVVLEPARPRPLDETVVISAATSMGTEPAGAAEAAGAPRADSHQVTNDSSLLTEDDSEEIEDTPPRSLIPVKQPVSAVKERVQQFEELAGGGGGGGARLTRTKTRALAKQSADGERAESPCAGAARPPALSSATLAKLHNLPPSGYKPLSVSSSASKARSNIVATVKSFLPAPASTSKAAAAMAAAARMREAEEQAAEKEDARRKKEALLEAKREEGRRRREQKMAAAAAMREELARERAAQLEATAKGRQEKQAHADQGKLEKLREVEKKRQAMERKAAETEARRRAEEAARQARLEEEQRRAEAARRKQQEEAERIKKEELRVEREMQQARQLYLEKEKERERQKLLQKHRMAETDKMHTPMKLAGTPCKPMAPVHMADGFQHLNSESEEDDEKPKRTPPDWSRSKARWERLVVQERVPASHVDKLFSVQRHTPDLRELFPAIDRRMLKRTSSAVWRTPPRLPQLPE